MIFDEPGILRKPHECDHVVEWLAKRLPREPMAVVVSWDNQLAIHTDTEIVVKYWDSFFYPSSDDTLVWPVDEAWILAYFHDDTIYFATRRERKL